MLVYIASWRWSRIWEFVLRSVSLRASKAVRSIPLLLSISPRFACTCLFHCLNYVFYFVFRPSWLQNFVFETPWQSRLILNRTISHSISVQLRNHIQFSFVSCSIHNSHKVRSLSVRSQPTFPPLSPKLSFHRGRIIRPRQRSNWNSCLQCSDSMVSDFIVHRYPSLILDSYDCSHRCESLRVELERRRNFRSLCASCCVIFSF